MKKWGIYTRISDDGEGAGLGVSRQERDNRALIERVDPGAEVVVVYSDNDISAYAGKPRPDYDRLLGDIAEGRVNAIASWHNDRLHRSPRELEDFIDLVERRGVRVVTVKAGELDLATPSGRMVARQLGAVARYESEHKAERIKAKHIELASAGVYIGGGHRPYGYRVLYDREERPHHVIGLEVVPQEAVIVREMVRRALAGEALAAMCRDLNRRGVPTTTGRQWSTTSLSRLLVSARIAGLREHSPRSRHETKRLRLGTITGKGNWPAIITEAESQRLRVMLTDPTRRTSPGATGKHLCTGLLYCGRCEQRMVGRSKSKGRRAYMCDGLPGRPGCGRMHIEANGTDRVAAAWAAEALASEEYRRKLSAPQGPDEAEVLAEITAAERKLEELAAEYGAEDMTRLEWLAARKPVEARLRAARGQLRDVDSSRVLDGVPSGRAELEAFLLDPDIEASRRRSVILLALVRVMVAPAVWGRNRFDADRLTPVWRR